METAIAPAQTAPTAQAGRFAQSMRTECLTLAGVRSTVPDPTLRADLGVRPLPPLVLQAGHVGEAVPPDEHVARVDRSPR